MSGGVFLCLVLCYYGVSAHGMREPMLCVSFFFCVGVVCGGCVGGGRTSGGGHLWPIGVSFYTFGFSIYNNNRVIYYKTLLRKNRTDTSDLRYIRPVLKHSRFGNNSRRFYVPPIGGGGIGSRHGVLHLFWETSRSSVTTRRRDTCV